MKTVQSTIEPEAIVIDEYSVWVADNVREITATDEEGVEHIEYEYELTRMTKDEYILRLHQGLESSTTKNELALAELAELLLGGRF